LIDAPWLDPVSQPGHAHVAQKMVVIAVQRSRKPSLSPHGFQLAAPVREQPAKAGKKRSGARILGLLWKATPRVAEREYDL
jgi:hypothetical protein